ncbi:uncharacterized protein METZ01_LOCUS14972 [marine metagenome]|uniref:DUF3810 domain-containing protein n=1 Tax=marine metagenome TaxID=408172 RepID=A0A381P7C5_9ZZZZ
MSTVMEHELHWRSRLALAGTGVVTFGLFRLLIMAPGFTETIYGRGIGPLFASLLSNISGIIPVSLAEILVVVFVVRQLSGVIKGFSQVRNDDRQFSNAIAAGVLRLGADVGIVVTTFYLLWGFNYARPSLEVRQQWNGSHAQVEELARLAQEMINAANFEYVSITGSEDLGQPTTAPQHATLVEQLSNCWKSAEGILGLPRSALLRFGNPKRSWASFVLDYGQTSGFYFPWTGEANYNWGTPDVSTPQVIAHEMSHQRGFAREDEANFAGYLAASLSDESYPRYSAYVFAQRQLLSALSGYDTDHARELVRQRLPGVQRDIRAANAYWQQFEGHASRTTRSMNNAYLRTNRVPGGILSYNRSVELLIGYARSRGGWLINP